MHRDDRILIMICYDIDIGYAIGRLISTFYEMGIKVVGESSRVHFSFSKIGEQKSAALPVGFSNVVEFCPRAPTENDVNRLSTYVKKHRITAMFALDLSVNAHYLAPLRDAGVRQIFSYWGAPMSSINHGLKLLLKRLEVRLLRGARPEYFIFESRAMQDFAVNGRGVPALSTTVVHTGVDAEKFQFLPHAASLVYQRFAIPLDRKIIVYMGHLHQRKGVHVLMQAAAHLKTILGRNDIHTLFLGNRNDEEGAFREYYEEAATHVTFGGYQSDIPALLSGCYAGCIPSTGWDSFPMSSLEMQACGLPVFVSDWQGVPETVVDQETGIVVPVGDAARLAAAIASLVDEPHRRSKMSSAARKRIESAFTVKHQVDNLVAYVAKRLARANNEY
jgi:glycosyltransferase involved in cell wall biosynthesis